MLTHKQSLLSPSSSTKNRRQQARGKKWSAENWGRVARAGPTPTSPELVVVQLHAGPFSVLVSREKRSLEKRPTAGSLSSFRHS